LLTTENKFLQQMTVTHPTFTLSRDIIIW